MEQITDIGFGVTVERVVSGDAFRYDIYKHGVIIGAFGLGYEENSAHTLRAIVQLLEEQGALFNHKGRLFDGD